jgi:hypothetical protein
MLLSEVLAKKPRKNKTLDQQLQEVEDDPSNKRCVFLHLTGTYDNPIITFDKKGMKEKIKEDIKQEKQSLKQILNEEFGLFKKDSTLKKTKEIKPETKFEIEFGKDSKSNKGKTIKKESPEEDEDF